MGAAMTRPADVPEDVWEQAGLWLVGRAHLEPSDQLWVARAILAERERATESTLDAANSYLTEQYGNSALGNPIDRERVNSIRAGATYANT